MVKSGGFTERSAKRIAATVTGWERQPEDRTYAPDDSATPTSDTCWGKLTAKVADGFEWVEVYRKLEDDTNEWVEKEGAREGDNALDEEVKNLAVELVPGTAAVEGVYLLRRWAKKKVGSPEKWISEWVIVRPNTQVLVRVDEAADGGGKYTGVVLQEPSTDVTDTGSLAASDLGTEVAELEALILNIRELGSSSHYLTDDGNGELQPIHFLGMVRRVNEDGTVVVAIDGFKWFSCAEDEEPTP